MVIKITPFELQFGKKPAIHINILLPNTELHDREIVIKEFQTIDKELGEIIVLEDEKTIESKLPVSAKIIWIILEHQWKIVSS